MPFFSRPWHNTSVERWPVGYLPAFGFLRLPCRVPRRLLSEAYQSQMHLVCSKNKETTDEEGCGVFCLTYSESGTDALTNLYRRI